MLARIMRDIVKGVILLGPCKSAISVSLQQLQRVAVSVPISSVMKALSCFSPKLRSEKASPLFRIQSVETSRPTAYLHMLTSCLLNYQLATFQVFWSSPA
ncbi:MAG: hypothetical protein GY924_13010 [Planctomycetaceae bacterium]|nr:hypothetical protein [Planctomycetaceae bacterium]